MGIIVSFGVALPRICSAIYYPGQTVPSLFPVLALNSFTLITRHGFTLANPPPPPSSRGGYRLKWGNMKGKEKKSKCDEKRKKDRRYCIVKM
jgi:hypothetical protein